MRFQVIGTWILAATAAVASADPATQPLLPVDEIPVPAPRTVAVAAPVASTPAPAAAPAWSRVVILPFETIGDADPRQWVVRAVQQTLSAETARLGGIIPISAPAPAAGAPIDTDAALNVARTYGGDVVVFGAVQFAAGDVRFTGQVVAAKTGAPIAGLKASGDFRDLFALEDMLSSQLDRALRPPAPVADSRAQDQNLIFTQPAPALTAADLYTPLSDTQLFAGDYQRYYYDQNDVSPFLYGGYGYGWGGYGYGLGLGGIGYYPSFYGNYYGAHDGYGGYGGYGGHGGYGHGHGH
jgi:TolB-like protein